MAAILTDVEVGLAFTATATTAPLDGLVQADFDRVDQDYSVDEGNGDGVVKARRLVVLRYEPPANTPNIDYYGNQGKPLPIKLVGRGTTYTPVLRQVIMSWEDRGGSAVLVLTMFLVVPAASLSLQV